VAAPHEFHNSQQYFHQTVILLTELSPTEGAKGFILNRPTQYRMRQVADVKEFREVFGNNVLYFGGDVGDGEIAFLHPHPGVHGCTEVRSGVFAGAMADRDAIESAAELVLRGEAQASDFKFFVRFAGWHPGQVERECASGIWHPLACARSLALKPMIKLPKPLWREVLELCGGDHALMSKRAYNDVSS